MQLLLDEPEDGVKGELAHVHLCLDFQEERLCHAKTFMKHAKGHGFTTKVAGEHLPHVRMYVHQHLQCDNPLPTIA